MAKFIAPVVEATLNASGNPKAHEIFAGKTIAMVFNEYKLSPNDIKIGEGDFNGTPTAGLIFTVNGVEWSVPLSAPLLADNESDLVLDDMNYFWKCQFFAGHQAVRDADDRVKKDDDGRIILDTTKPILCITRPRNSYKKVSKFFDDEEANDNVAADKSLAKIGG